MRVFIASTVLIINLFLTTSIASAADYPPGLMFSTVLNGVKVLQDDGRLRLDNIQAVFLPDASSPTGREAYNPDDGGKIWAILSKSDGTELYRLDFYGEKLQSPYWLLSAYTATDLATNNKTTTEWLEGGKTGSYVLDFYLESGKFYTFPFKISKYGSGDPFGPGDLYYAEGDWERWGYFYYYEANPDQSLAFKVWLSNKGKAKQSDVKIKIKIFNKASGSLVCMSREGMTHTIKPEWIRYEFDMVFAEGAANPGQYFKARDLVNKDGNYVLKMFIDDEIYGQWHFTVEGGKLKPVGRTLRGGDPLVFIEGGKDAFWYERM